MKKMKLILACLFAATLLVNAQTADNKFAVGLNFVKNEYKGDYGNGIFNFKQPWMAGGGLSLATYLNPSFDLGLQGTLGSYGYFDQSKTADQFTGSKFDASLFTHYKLNNGYILSKESKLSPFISLGLGFATYGTINNATPWPTIITKGTDFIVPLGVGLKYQITSSFAVQYQYLYNITNADNHDQNRGANYFGSAAHSSVSGNDAFGEHQLGIAFSFGGPIKEKAKKAKKVIESTLDSDGDGVIDSADKCPDTPKGVAVDAAGCPIDSDGDGVPDYLDKSPNTPAGVRVDATGTPLDSDGDGVADYLDKCPNTPSGVKVDASGCPLDSDGDGVPDYMDKCPDVSGSKANSGCPEVKVEPKTIILPVKNVQFVTGKYNITKSYAVTLNKFVKELKKNPSYKVEIKGNTDNVGSDAFNQKLSEKRANAVKKYLESKGITSDRLTANGYSFKFPISTNSTAAGRAKNRRVEFNVNQ